MAIPELDLKKVNLQSAVGYLISLHDNEVDWNLLGIKVIGAIDSLPIPAGDYEYGDAYMVGTETPYDMYIYTRPDGEVHTEGYWFPIGKFPAPGPQGPKGDGLEQIYKWTNGTVSNVVYDTTDGAKTTQTTTIDYTDSTDGSTKQQQFNSTTTLPIVPGKYMSMDATADNKKLEVKVDDTALALDYFKIDKGPQAAPSAPIYLPQTGSTSPMYVTSDVIKTSIASRDGKGNSSFNAIYANQFYGTTNTWQQASMNELYRACNTLGCDQVIEKTSSNTGTIGAGLLGLFQETPNTHIVYDNQVYYRMDPTSAPDGTLNFIHLDSIQDGEGGYKLTAKCFSITVSTRAWKVIDLSLAGYKYTHNLTIYDQVQDGNIYLSYVTDDQESYANRPEDLIQSIENKNLPCTYKSTDSVFSAGTLTSDGMYLTITYGSNETSQMTNSQVTIEDYVS